MRLALLQFLFFFSFHTSLIAQFAVSGYVFDRNTNQPLFGASVFYDGSTIGTITNEDGFFKLISEQQITGNLIFDFLGYETKILSTFKKGSLGTIFLNEKPLELKEVTLLPDTWSRSKKLRIFRKEFLGNTKAGSRCKILNENDIRLYYSATENRLYAFADRPIKILNRYLGYEIRYHLIDFEADFFRQTSEPPIVRSNYMAGTILFKDLHKSQPKKKYIKNRSTTYLGSGMHFMRSLAEQKLKEEGFTIYRRRFPVNPKEVFSISTTDDGITQIIQRTKKLIITYMGEQSSIHATDSFFIDGFGNYTPSRNILFGGKIGEQRAGNLLPLNYVIE